MASEQALDAILSEGFHLAVRQRADSEPPAAQLILRAVVTAIKLKTIGLEKGGAATAVKRVFNYYALKRLDLDTDPSVWRPQDQKVVLLNTDRVMPLKGRRANS